MFTVQVATGTLSWCQSILTSNNLGHRKDGNGTSLEQLTGVVGQQVVMDIFGVGLINEKMGFDGGVDFTYNHNTVDVKVVGRTVYPKPHYSVEVVEQQIKYDVDVYIFCSFHKVKNDLTVCGWMTKHEFLKKARHFRRGEEMSRDDGTKFNLRNGKYECCVSDLHSPENESDLVEQILNVSIW
jgi:hypothetical protein